MYSNLLNRLVLSKQLLRFFVKKFPRPGDSAEKKVD